MRFKIFWILYLLIAMLVAFSAYRSKGKEGMPRTLKTVEECNASHYMEWMKGYNVDREYAKVWGIGVEPKVESTKNHRKQAEKKRRGTKILFVRKGQEICRGKAPCARALGIVEREGRRYGAFFLPKHRKPIVELSPGESLPDLSLSLQKIEKGCLSIKEENGSGRWNFCFFDVNVTKYRPKDLNVSND